MFYESISEIKLSRFIRMCTGDVRAVIKEGEHTDQECIDKSSDLIMEYMDICNNKAVLLYLEKRKKILRLKVKMRVLEICKVLLDASQYEDVAKIMSNVGYRINANDHDKMKARVEQQINKCLFDMDLISKEKEEGGREMTARDFTRERVAIMSHYKMHVDPDVFTAEEYACLVAQFNREVDDMIKRNARMNK